MSDEQLPGRGWAAGPDPAAERPGQPAAAGQPEPQQPAWPAPDDTWPTPSWPEPAQPATGSSSQTQTWPYPPGTWPQQTQVQQGQQDWQAQQDWQGQQAQQGWQGQQAQQDWQGQQSWQAQHGWQGQQDWQGQQAQQSWQGQQTQQGWPPPPPGQAWPGQQSGWGGWQPPPPRRRTNPLTPILAILAAVLVAIAAVVGGGALVWSSMPHPSATHPFQVPGNTADPSNAGGATPQGPDVPASVASTVSPAVVMINSTFEYQNASGAGTGIVLDAAGEVLTNNHVINGATRIEATDVGNGKTYQATVLGYDASHDLAVLRLRGASGLQTAKLGDSGKITVGQAVMALGNAGGAGGAPSSATGRITGLNQSITASDELNGTVEQLAGLIEVDANVQPGDSGGPLVNGSGQVIGIDTAASAGMRFQATAGRGYAIPINQALRMVDQVASGRGSDTVHVGATAFLGVLLGSASSGQGGGGAPSSGAPIRSVVPGGAAAKAGLAAGDVITSLAGHTIDSPSTLSSVMSGMHPGDRLPISWTDTLGRARSGTVVLGSGPPA